MIGSEDYPNATAAEHNDNYTSFTVTTKSEELGFNESFSVLSFYIYGGMYNSFNGTPADNIHVDFINEASGEVIDSFDSENMGDGSTDWIDGECVGYSTNYFMNEDGKLKPGESLTKQFDYYNGTFDEAKYYFAGTISK